MTFIDEYDVKIILHIFDFKAIHKGTISVSVTSFYRKLSEQENIVIMSFVCYVCFVF